MQWRKPWRIKHDPCGYIKAILNSWKAKGITTLAEAQEEKKAKQENEPELMADVWAKFMANHKEEETYESS